MIIVILGQARMRTFVRDQSLRHKEEHFLNFSMYSTSEVMAPFL